jgi:hypothetical protein
MFPVIQLASAVAAVVGGCTLLWYDSLSKAQQAEADRLAMEYARRLYRKALDELMAHEARHVHDLVKERFTK